MIEGVFRLSKKGAGVAVMFFTFFSIMMIVAAGIFWGVNLLYGRGYDFREAEALLLNEQVKNCLQAGNNGRDVFSETFDFYKTCRLSKKVIEDGGHFVLVKLKDDSQKKVWGTADFENTCEFKGGKDNIDFPICASVDINLNGKDFVISTGSSQHSKRIQT